MIPKTREIEGALALPADTLAAIPWRRELSRAVSDPAELLRLLELPRRLLPAAEEAARRFPLRVPRGFIARMRRGDPCDPLLQQVLPLGRELVEVAGFVGDPVGDLQAAARPALLHKYQGRALLIVAGGCAVNCRYCFRREFPYADHSLNGVARREALRYLAADPTLSEVILSGGDPLLWDDVRLAELVEELARIPHLRRLRIHTRLPIVLPERLDGPLLDWLNGSRLRPVMVVHANHPREIDGAVASRLERLRDGGVTLLNQAVLLAGINDSAAVLTELSERLFAAGVLPYYLHMLDRVRGAAHFEVGRREAGRIVRQLAERLPGYLVPKLVREQVGASAKVPVELQCPA